MKEDLIEKVFHQLEEDFDPLTNQMVRDSFKNILSEKNSGKLVGDIFSNGAVKSIDRKEFKRKLFYSDTNYLSGI